MNEKTTFGLLSTIEVPFALKPMGSCWSKKGLLLANYIYTDSEEVNAFELVYTLIDSEGAKREIVESEGILPTLFLNPNQENFVAVATEKEGVEGQEILSVIKRSAKADTESFFFPDTLAGRFVGCTKSNSIFYEVDIWKDTQQDVLTYVRFHDSLVKEVKKVNIPFPKGNKVYVHQNEIHLITEVESGWLHRQLNEEGIEVRRRVLEFDFPFVHEALRLSFDDKSFLLCEEYGEIGIVEIDEEGNCLFGDLYDLGDEFFGTWHPQAITATTSAVQFTTEYGNGWLVIDSDNLIELVYNKNKTGYENKLTKEVLNLGANDMILSSISAITDNQIGLIFHPRKARKEVNNKLYVLQHTIQSNVAETDE